MIVDLLDKLVDRCIQLVKHKEESHRKLYEDFVDPIQKNFEAVHANYIETFQNYRELLKAPEPALDKDHPIFDKVQQDSLFSAGTRAMLQINELSFDEPLLRGFLGAISVYMDRTQSPVLRKRYDGYFRLFNVPRTHLSVRLQHIFRIAIRSEAKRAFGIKILDQIVAELQRHFAIEVAEFTKLKSVLLKPK